MKKLLFLISLLCSLVSCNSLEKKEYQPIGPGEISPTNQAILTYLKQTDYEKWKLFPDSVMLKAPNQMKRLGLPVHGRWVKTYVNDIAYDFILKAKKGEVAQLFEFPVGSFIIKQNFRSTIDTTKTIPIHPDNATIGAITLLYKPSPKFKFCATKQHTSYNGEDCLGGEWFYGFFFQDDIVKGLKKPFKGVQDSIQANVNSFCINCHAPGYNTDYVRTLDNLVNPFAEESTTNYCNRFEDSSTNQNIPFNTEAPNNFKLFSENVSSYINDVTLTPKIPGDVPADPTQVFQYLGAETTQLMFDSYAWKTFIALNWPNEKLPQRGKADEFLAFNKNENNASVWETFKPTFEVFQPEIASWNPKNQPWDSPMPVPEGKDCFRLEHDFVVTMASKTRDIANETGQAFAGIFGNLIDQEGNQVRYEVLFNRTEFEYLIGNDRAATKNLTPSGPKGEANKVNFPDTKDDTAYNQGAMEIKSAWKELCVNDNCKQRDAENLTAAKKKFLVRTAIIYDEETKSCRKANMALVGLHIARKTYFAPQWIWMTFEHKDNVPMANDKAGKGTFYNTDLGLNEPDNCYQLPFLYPDPRVAGCPNVDINRFIGELKNQPNQITRLVPISKEAQQINAQYQSVLKTIDSPFANYILVNAQWPLKGRQQNGTVSTLNCKDNGMGTDCFTMKPRFLRNAVIESYMATYCDSNGDPEQFSNRSCMSCHYSAGANLSYIWLDAVSQKVKVQTP